ncbi:hypothetical protein [Psychromonas sp.]|uniref:hypothetical protein n=1 Tax=Psychromonas sp. TaxID=1884585 RepID=UPI003A978C03
MNSIIKITDVELIELYTLIEKIEKFFRDPNNYSDLEKVAEFKNENYHLIKKYYADIFLGRIGHREGVFDIINE